MLSLIIGLTGFLAIFFYSEFCLDYKNALPVTLLVATDELIALLALIVGVWKIILNWLDQVKSRLNADLSIR